MSFAAHTTHMPCILKIIAGCITLINLYDAVVPFLWSRVILENKDSVRCKGKRTFIEVIYFKFCVKGHFFLENSEVSIQYLGTKRPGAWWYWSLLKNSLTHSLPMHPFSTPWKHQKTVRFSGVSERVHWERMG